MINMPKFSEILPALYARVLPQYMAGLTNLSDEARKRRELDRIEIVKEICKASYYEALEAKNQISPEMEKLAQKIMYEIIDRIVSRRIFCNNYSRIPIDYFNVLHFIYVKE